MPVVSFLPETYKLGFKKILSFEEEEFQSIQEALSQIQPELSLSKLVDEVTKATDRSFDGLLDMFQSAGSLSPFLESDRLEELANDITVLAIEEGLIETRLSHVFKSRLLYLLSNDNIFCSARGQDLLSEYQNIFLNSRVVTDIRPIFNIDIKQSPKGGVIVHNLNIHYRSSNTSEHQDIYFALDSDDIHILSDSLIRAIEKEKSLNSIFENTGMKKIQ